MFLFLLLFLLLSLLLFDKVVPRLLLCLRKVVLVAVQRTYWKGEKEGRETSTEGQVERVEQKRKGEEG